MDNHRLHIQHQIMDRTDEQFIFSIESQLSRFIFPIQIEPNSSVISLKVSLLFESSDPYCRFPFNVWIRVGASARLVRVIEIDSSENEEVFFLPLEDPGLVLLELDCDDGIFNGANSQVGRRLRLTVALSDAEVDTPTSTSSSASSSEISRRTSALDNTEPTSRPIFVVGMYRSGTSILTWALGQHPNIWALEETGFLPIVSNATAAAWIRASNAARSFSSVYELSSARFNAHFSRAVDALMMELAKEHAMRCTIERANNCAPDFDPRIQALRSLGSPKQRWVDGTPENIVAIAQLSQLFPEARFIHIVRHPIHVAASMMHFDKIGGNPMTAADAAQKWYDRVKLGYLSERALGSKVIMRVSYDDLTANPVSILNRIFAFLGEPAFDRASHCFREKINSSSTGVADWEEAMNMIDDTELTKYLDLYQELSDASMRFDRPLADARLEFNAAMSDKVGEFLLT